MSEHVDPLGPYPATALQQGMLFHAQVEQHSGVDIEQMLIRLEEVVDLKQMAAAWQQICLRYPVLTSTFHTDTDGHFRIRESREISPIQLESQDISTLGEREQEEAVKRFLLEDRLRGFDLSAGPAMRICIFKLASNRTLMVWSFHHILLDGRGFTIVIREVLSTYDALKTGTTGGRQVDRGPAFREYVRWSSSIDHREGLEFWRERLRGYQHTSLLPHCTRDLASAAYGEIWGELDPKTTAELNRDISDTEFSLNTLLLAAWSIALSRYGNTDDVLFGITKTTRGASVSDAEHVVGLLLATLPLRIEVHDHKSIRDLLTQIRSSWNALKPHEQVPLADIKRVASGAHADFFETLVVFERERFGDLLRAQGGPWSTRTFELREQSGYAATLYGYGGERLSLKLGFDRRKINEECAGRMLGHVRSLLEQMVQGLDQPLATLQMLSAEELALTTQTWNQSSVPFDLTVPVDALVEESAKTHRDAIAVQFGERTVTYAQLQASIEQIAARLRAGGVRRGDRVGLMLPRDERLPAALLAVLRAGAAYIPLDSELPSARLSHMVQDSDLKLVLTSAELLEIVSPLGVRCLEIDGSTAAEARSSDEHRDSTDVAYTLYTSGSTGLPKGVEIEHRSLTNFLLAMQQILRMRPGDKLGAITTISFDIAALELFLPLIAGATVVIVPRETSLDGAELASFIDRVQPTYLQGTPTTWRMIFESGWTKTTDLVALCGGEAMTEDLAAKLSKSCRTVWNVYGPTETTVWSTAHQVQPGAPISIGRPIANTRTYVVDSRLRPVPLGCTGELLIGGAGVARGYRNRLELTRERFIADPFVADGRVYRTGDLARFSEDGTLECLGRNDSQVKVRGFRIELGEIESALERHPQVRRCAVVARKVGSAPEPSLVAYVVADGEIGSKQIRDFLHGTLPGYMVPSHFVMLDALPETPNRKIDRNALPAPIPDQHAEAVTHLPNTHSQIKIAEAFKRVLGLADVDIDADFFDLGGTSVSAARLFAQLNNTFGRRFSLNTLFHARTIRELSAQIEKALGHEEVEHALVRIRPSGTATPLFWVPGGRAVSALAFRHLVELLPGDIPVYSFETRLNSDLVFSTVEERAKSYLELIRDIQPEGPYRIGGFCLGGFVAFEIARLLIEAGEKIDFLGLVNSYLSRPLNVAEKVLQTVQRAARKLKTVGNGTQRVASVEAHDADFLSEQRNMQVMTKYVPRALEVEIDLYTSEISEFAGLSARFDTRRTWTGLASSSRIATIPGDHTSMLEPPHVSELAAHITRQLNGKNEATRSFSATGDD